MLNLMVKSNGHPDTLKAYADWLEQQGEHKLAYAYRWAASRGRWPMIKELDGRRWWHWSRMPMDGRAVIPTSIKTQMNRFQICMSLEGAFQELADALARIKEDVSIDE